MAPDTRRTPSVLVIDPDAGIRGLLGTVLEHSGFCTAAAPDLESAAPLLHASSIAAVVRDLNFSAGERRRTMQELASTPPDLLQRTVIITTAAERAASAIRPGTVFAIIGKPFDIGEVVNAVKACVGSSRPTDAAAEQPSDHSSLLWPQTEPAMKLESLQAFVSKVPNLQHLLSVPVTCQREAALRTEMRRTLGVLASTLMDAADVEPSMTRAEVYRAASTVAEQLATASAPAVVTRAVVRNH